MVVALQKRVSFIGTQENAYHSHLYHGCASRGGIAYPSFRDYRIGDALEVGVDILRSSCDCPAITIPSLNWIVDETVKHGLEALGNVQFLKPNSTRSYALAVNEVESFTEGFTTPIPPSRIHDDAIERLGESKSDFKLWEVVVPRGSDLESERADCTLRWTMHEDGEETELNFQMDLLQQHPFIIQEGTYLLSENLFSRLSSFIDERFFYVDQIQPE